MAKDPILSVVLTTHNRAALLQRVLAGLAEQSARSNLYELLIVDDGSTDRTPDVVADFAKRMPVRYYRQAASGLAIAKNHGLYHSRGEVALFLDDDDIPAPGLVEEHIAMHETYPAKHYAVLGLTVLESSIAVRPLMHFATKVGCYLSAYVGLTDGDVLDYTYYWGGRTSCKRALFAACGIFNPVFRFGCEDIELGYRLREQGLKVVFAAEALSTMIRDIPFNEFCRRLERQGQSQYVFYKLHPFEEIARWTQVNEAAERWPVIRDGFARLVERARCLDVMANDMAQSGMELTPDFTQLLYEAYWTAFDACKFKGIQEVAQPRTWPSEPERFCYAVTGS